MSNVVNKKALADAVSDKYELTKKASAEIVDLLFEEMITALKAGTPVEIAGFGKFVIKVREARSGINPKTKEKIQIPASKVPAFKAAKALKEEVN